MSFLNPIFLWAFAALSIPLIIHLLNRQKTQVLKFSSTFFFKPSVIKKSRIKRINKLIQLLVRMFILFLLVLLFAGPFNSNTPFTKLNSKDFTLYCWIDNSISMDLKLDSNTVLEKSISALKYLDSTLACNILIFDKNSFKEAKKYKNLKSSYKPNRFNVFLKNYKTSFLEKRKSKSGILIISDLQKNDKELLNFINNPINTLTLVIHPIIDKIQNISITDISVKQKVNTEISAALKIQNINSPIQINLISDKMRRDEKTLSTLKMNDTTITLISSEKLKYGEININFDDQFIHDNTQYFSNSSEIKPEVLFIKETGTFSPFYQAFITILDTNATLIEREPFKVTGDDLESANLIVINGLSSAASSLFSLIRSSNFTKKSIIFSPSLNRNAKFFNKEFLNFFGINEIKFDTITLQPSLQLSSEYLFQDFKNADIKDIEIKKSLENLKGRAILKSQKGSSLISIHSDQNNNRWIISSFPLDRSETNNLCLSGIYIPLIYNLVTKFGIERDISELSFTAGVPFTPPIAYGNEGFSVKNINDKKNTLFFNNSPITLENTGIFKITSSESEIFIPLNPPKKELNLSFLTIDKNSRKDKKLKFIPLNSLPQKIKNITSGNFDNLLIIILLLLFLVDLIISISINNEKATKLLL